MVFWHAAHIVAYIFNRLAATELAICHLIRYSHHKWATNQLSWYSFVCHNVVGWVNALYNRGKNS